MQTQVWKAEASLSARQCYPAEKQRLYGTGHAGKRRNGKRRFPAAHDACRPAASEAERLIPLSCAVGRGQFGRMPYMRMPGPLPEGFSGQESVHRKKTLPGTPRGFRHWGCRSDAPPDCL